MGRLVGVGAGVAVGWVVAVGTGAGLVVVGIGVGASVGLGVDVGTGVAVGAWSAHPAMETRSRLRKAHTASSLRNRNSPAAQNSEATCYNRPVYQREHWIEGRLPSIQCSRLGLIGPSAAAGAWYHRSGKPTRVGVDSRTSRRGSIEGTGREDKPYSRRTRGAARPIPCQSQSPTRRRTQPERL